MKRSIDVKHVAARRVVQTLLDDLMDRLEEKLKHFPDDAVSVRAVFEENGRRTLYRTSLTCHVPRHTIVAHDEHRDPGLSIRNAFAEVERQLERRKATIFHEHGRRRSRRIGRSGTSPERRDAAAMDA